MTIRYSVGNSKSFISKNKCSHNYYNTHSLDIFPIINAIIIIYNMRSLNKVQVSGVLVFDPAHSY